MNASERAARRRATIVATVVRSFEEAESWDLDFWLRLTPQERLSALVDLREEAERIFAAKKLALPEKVGKNWYEDGD